nr:TetR/AcrR family transcriptional regulator [Bacillus benzoevorans]
MEKALELFAKNGFEATSIQQITEKCGISKGAFYLSFKSKDELILSIIDHFMSTIAAEIERAVNDDQHAGDLLYQYYFVFFRAYERHADFAKLFIKELSAMFNPELIERILVYHAHLTKVVFSIIERQFPQTNSKMRADLVFVIQGFVKNYGELFFIDHASVDLHELCTALVEKTEILARHAAIPVLAPEFFAMSVHERIAPTKEQLMEVLMRKINEIDDPILLESLELLTGHLRGAALSPAIIQGLLKNLSSSPHTKWTASLYQKYEVSQ